MKFVKIQEARTSNVIECNELDNDVLVRKTDDKIYNYSEVKINEKQYAILLEKGKVIAVCYEPGIYKISFDEQDCSVELRKWREYNDEKTKKLPLSLIFINLQEITDNKFYMKKPIEYIDWTNCTYNEETKKEEPLKTRFIGNGKFNFKIENPVLFLNSILGIREHYTKQELIEQIRKTVVNSIQLGINELGEEYKLSVQLVKNKTNELEIRVSQNNYDEKLAQRGIKITYFEITNFEEVEQVKEESRKENFEQLFLQLYKISKKAEFIDAKNMVIKVDKNGEIITQKLGNFCRRCGNEIDADDKYCTFCGAMVKQ
mgnify:CR=1 FL=1